MKKIVNSLLILSSYLLSSEIHLEVNNIASNCNSLKIGLYNTKESFLVSEYKQIELKPTNQKLLYTISNIPNDIYTVALYCDENNNGKLDKNFFGIPKEAYGFSNNPKIFTKPDYDEIKFTLKDTKEMIIRMTK